MTFASARIAVLMGLSLISGACVIAPRSVQQEGPPPSAVYRLAPPDGLQIVVRGVEPVIDRNVQVRPDGKISFDLIGEVDVQSRTVGEVREEIAKRLREFIVAPDVTVILRESNSRRYYIFGEVSRVGAYSLVGEVTAIEALASAGGATFLANENGAWLSRPESETQGVYRIRYKDITRGDGRTNYALRPGDVIYVPPGVSAQIGNALQVIFYPLQQIVGLGGNLVRP
jgi:polysaccharide biosynthesis/export protein